jgi:hypothetical protein
MNINKEIESAGVLLEDKTFKFNFARFDKEAETYNGNTAKIK